MRPPEGADGSAAVTAVDGKLIFRYQNGIIAADRGKARAATSCSGSSSRCSQERESWSAPGRRRRQDVSPGAEQADVLRRGEVLESRDLCSSGAVHFLQPETWRRLATGGGPGDRARWRIARSARVKVAVAKIELSQAPGRRWCCFSGRLENARAVVTVGNRGRRRGGQVSVWRLTTERVGIGLGALTDGLKGYVEKSSRPSTGTAGCFRSVSGSFRDDPLPRLRRTGSRSTGTPTRF